MNSYGADGEIVRSSRQSRLDGWINPYTGYGGSDDNIENTSYYPDYGLTESELNAIYEAGGVWARSVEAPVRDRLGKGIEFIQDDDNSKGQIAETEKLKNDIDKIRGIAKLIEGNYWGRLHGGGLLYFDYGDDQDIKGLNRNINFALRDSQRGLPSKIWVVDRWMAIPQSYYNDYTHGADHPLRGEPEIYSLNLLTTGFSKLVYAHESRCIKIDGLPLAPRRRAAKMMWGLPLFDRVYKVMRFLGVSMKSMTDILEDWNYKSLGIPGLADKLMHNTDADIQAMFKALGIAAKSMNNQNIGMHDLEGGLTKHASRAGGINEIVGSLVNFFCGEVGIPYSRLFSAEGGALAGTAAETDVKNYHESLKFERKHRDEPAIKRMIWLLGYEPENFPFTWPPLQESNRKEQLEERDKQADVDVKYIQNGVVMPEEIRVSRFSNPEPNLDQVIIDHELDEIIKDTAMEDETADESEDEEKNMPKNEPENKNKRSDISDDVLDENEEIELYLSDNVRIGTEDVE